MEQSIGKRVIEEGENLPPRMHRITAYCGRATCHRCGSHDSRFVSNWVPSNPACAHFGEMDESYRIKDDAYKRFYERLVAYCEKVQADITCVVRLERPLPVVQKLIAHYNAECWPAERIQ
jgi:hypothetical protein